MKKNRILLIANIVLSIVTIAEAAKQLIDERNHKVVDAAIKHDDSKEQSGSK